jgi:hypothetical protein
MRAATMRLTPFQAPPAGDTWREWLKFLLPSGLLGTFLTIIGWRGVIRPAITRALFYFLFKHEDGKLLFQKYFGETMVDVKHELSQNTSAVRTLQGTFERFEIDQKHRDERIDEIGDSLDIAITRFDATAEKLLTAVARLDGATEERRANDHTHRRRGDSD